MYCVSVCFFFFFFNDTATTEIYTLSLHDALPISFEALAKLGTKVGVEGGTIRVEAPLLRMTKADIIRRGLALKAPLHLTHSCYDPDEQGRACGRCDSCRLRRKGFAEAQVPDPVVYRPGSLW